MWALPTILTLHTTGMAVLVGASWLLDLRLLGIGRSLPLPAFRWVFHVVALSLILNLTTGVLLFMQKAATWGTSIPFFIKMGLVIVSAGTLLPLRSFVLRSHTETQEVSANIRLMALVSILTWSGAVTAGRLLAYLEP